MNVIVPHGFEPNYTVGFVRGLVENNVAVTVVCGDDDEASLKAVGARTVNLRGSQDSSRSVVSKLKNLIEYYLRLIAFVFAHRGEVIHFTGLFRTSLLLWDGIFLSFIFRVLSAHYIYTAHNVLPHGQEKNRWVRALYRIAYRIPNTLVVHTKSSKRQLVSEFRVNEERIKVISIGLNEEVPVTDVDKQAARAKLGLSQESKVVLFFGKADDYKGLDLLIEAFELLDLREKTLVVAAWFPTTAYRNRVYDAISRGSVRDRIRMYEGFVPNEAVEIYFKCADVLCLPYRHVYQSGIIFLSMRLGTPIVATRVGAFPEYVGEEIGILAEECTPPKIGGALAAYFDSQPRFDRKRIISLAQDFRWKVVSRPLLGLYR